MNSNSHNSNSHQSWQPCPDGAIQSTSDAISEREAIAARRQFLKSAVGAALVVSAAGFTGYSVFGPEKSSGAFRPQPGLLGGIACSDVVANLPAYVKETLKDEALIDAMAVHLTLCKHCHEKYVCEKNNRAFV